MELDAENVFVITYKEIRIAQIKRNGIIAIPVVLFCMVFSIINYFLSFWSSYWIFISLIIFTNIFALDEEKNIAYASYLRQLEEIKKVRRRSKRKISLRKFKHLEP